MLAMHPTAKRRSLPSPADLEAPLDEHHAGATVAGRDVAQHGQVARLKTCSGTVPRGNIGRTSIAPNSRTPALGEASNEPSRSGSDASTVGTPPHGQAGESLMGWSLRREGQSLTQDARRLLGSTGCC